MVMDMMNQSKGHKMTPPKISLNRLEKLSKEATPRQLNFAMKSFGFQILDENKEYAIFTFSPPVWNDPVIKRQPLPKEHKEIVALAQLIAEMRNSIDVLTRSLREAREGFNKIYMFSKPDSFEAITAKEFNTKLDAAIDFEVSE
jgi:hypothetical protein